MGLNPNRKLNNTKWTSINTWKGYISVFNEVHPGNVYGLYENLRDYYYSVATSARYKTFMDELVMEEKISGKGLRTMAELPSQISFWVEQIKNAKPLGVKKQGNTNISQGQAIKLLESWQNILQLAQQQNWTSINTELNTLRNYCQALDSEIYNSSYGVVDLSSVIQTKNTNMYSIISSLEGTLSRIQGAILEEEAVRMIQEKYPTAITYQTGNIIVDGVKGKADILTLLAGMELKNEQGKTVYVFGKDGNIYDAEGNVAKNIILTQYEYDTLVNSAIGASAKTTSGQITFHQGYNINELLDKANIPKDLAIIQLIHIYQLGLQTIAPDPYQKYAVAKIASEIIGKENVFMITKNSIIPTYEYIQKLLKTPLRFSNKKIPSRGENTSLIESFGSTNIVGPSSK